MPGVSSTTSVLPLRVPNELLERLEALVSRLKTTRTDVGREALELGLEQLEKKLQGPAAAPATKAKRRTAADKRKYGAASRERRTAGKEKGSRAKKGAAGAAAATEALPQTDQDLVTFAAQVHEAAKRTKTGRFGDDRLFINHLWRQYKRDYKPRGMDLEAFKQQLVEANGERYLSLVCADMAPMLNQKDVRESEVRYLSATFHFLCT